MSTIIFTAHPSSKAFTRKIAEHYKKAKEKKGGKAEIIDLYRKEYYMDFLSFEDAKKIKEIAQQNTIIKKLQEKITQSDELVFVYPVWWGGMPAILKNFIDNVFVSGFAYDFDEKGRLHKLMKGKEVKLIMTGDASSVLYIALKPFYSILFKKVIFGFCGFKVTGIFILSEKFKRDEKELEAFLRKIELKA